MKKAILLGLLALSMTFNECGTETLASTEPTETVSVETETAETTETNYTYIICDVVELDTETFTALLPNGNLEIFYMIEDYPCDEQNNPYFEIVCFKIPTDTIDNLDTWEVVALR